MKIAIASSGLGHVARGIETWALDTATALHANGVDVTLFAGGTVGGRTSELRVEVVPCWKRYDRRTELLRMLMPGVSWRWGLKDGYGIEQLTFWRHLESRLRDGAFDVLHVQDPMVAYWCSRVRRKGRLKTKEILAHGTEESPEFLSSFDYVQHLAPWHLEQVDPARSHPHWTAVPNFVDTESFRAPIDEDEKRRCRERFEIPADAFVVGCSAAVKKHHKRIDYLIREFSAYYGTTEVPFLLIAGASQPDSAELVTLGQSLCGSQVRILTDVARENMPDLYRCMDVFVLSSLFEMMPIAVLEALSTGLPVIANEQAVLKWMVGDGGVSVDMSAKGALAQCLGSLAPDWPVTTGRLAREHAAAMFSKDVVIGQYIDYYQRVLSTDL